MRDLESIGKEIEESLAADAKPSLLLSLLRKRSKLVASRVIDNSELASQLIEENERWIDQSKKIMAGIRRKIDDNRISRERRASLQTAYDGISNAHTIFTHKG